MTIRDDMIRDRLQGVSIGISSALADPKTPDQYATEHAEALRLGVSDNELSEMTPEQKATREAEGLNLADWYATTPVFLQRIAGDSERYRYVKDDPLNASWIEKTWNTVTGGPGKADGIASAIGNSLARGGYALANTGMGFGNVSNLDKFEELNRRIAELDRIDKELSEGKPATVVFRRDDETSASVLKNYFLAKKDEMRAELEAQRGRIAENLHYNRMATALFPQSEKAQQVLGGGGGFWETGKKVLTNPSILADIGPESLAQFAPFLPAIAGASLFGGAPGAMLATGLASYSQDKNSTIAGQINASAKDPTVQAVLSVLDNKELMATFAEKAESHALPVAVLDALSLGVAGAGVIPRIIGRNMSNGAKLLAESALQMPIQGAMGAGGEALGQLNAEGEITSWGEVWAEFIGEHFTAPIEMAVAGSKAYSTAVVEQQQAEQKAEVFKQIGESAKTNPLIQRAPDVAEDYFQAVGEETQTPFVLVDAQALQQAGLLDSLVQVSPAAASQAEEAIRTGGEISIPTGEFITRVASTDLNEQLAPHVHFPDGPSLQQSGGGSVDIGSAIDNALRKRDPAFGASLSVVGKAVDTELDKLPITTSEKRTLGGLVVSLVESGASDLGVTPEEFWRDHGFNILDPSVQKPATLGNSKGSYFPNGKTIARWAEADESTLLHETGHWFFDVRSRISTTLLAKEKAGTLTEGEKHYLESTRDALKWLGVPSIEAWNNMSFDQQQPLQEKFARTYEAYLYEGKAPTAGLRRIFRQFSKWLKKIYAVITNIPDQDMNPNTRELFDRLFVAHEQVEEAKLRRNLDSILSNAFSDDKALAEYHDAIEERDEEAYEYLQSRLMKDLAFLGRWREAGIRKATNEGKRIRKALTARFEKAFDQSKTGKAVALFKNGIDVNGNKVKPKVLVQELSMLGLTPEQLKRLNEMGVVYGNKKNETFEGGDALANKLGYGSLSELVQDLLANGDKDAIVAQQVENEMVNNYSEFSNPKAIQQEVDKQLSGPASQRILASEIAALEKTQRRRIDLSFFREMARASIRKRKVLAIKPEAFRRQADKKALEAKKATRAGDFKLAARLKREQLYQTCLEHEARQFIDSQKKALRLYKKYATRKEVKGLETRYLIAIQGLLDSAGIKISEALKRDIVPLSTFIQECVNNGEIPPSIDDTLAARLANETQNGYSGMTADLAEELFDAVKQLEKLGKDVNMAKVNDEWIDLATVSAGINTAIENNAVTKGKGEKDNMEKSGLTAYVKDALSKVGMSHARIPSLLACMEGTRFGKLFEAIIKPADEANSVEEQLKTKYAIKLYKVFKPLRPKGLFREKKRYYAKQKANLTRSQVIAIALNMGNEGNINRMVEGSHLWRGVTDGQKLTEDDLREIVEATLTAEELKAVQGVWDVFKDIIPLVEAQEKRLTGRSLELVKGAPIDFTLPDGQTVHLAGGYYPIVYDRRASEKGAKLAAFDFIMARASGAVQSGSTFGGFLQSRAKSVSGLAVSLTTRGAFDGLANEIHRLAWEEWAVNTQKILKLTTPMMRRYWGANAVDAVNQWVMDVVSGNRGQNDMSDALANVLRSNISMAGIGFNPVTALIQPIGIINTTAVIGHRWTAKGIGEFLRKGPATAYREVAGKSAMMENRTRTRFRELTEIQATASGNVSAARDNVQRWAYKMIVMTQMLVDIPTWLGGYNKALSEGKTDSEAIAIADRVVIDAQGSGRVSDLSGIERGGAWSKLLTVFYTFFNAILNNVMTSWHTKKKLAFATDVLMLMCVQPVIETFIREGLKATASDGDAEDWYENSIKKAPWAMADFGLGLVVGLRELAGFWDNFAYSGPGGMRKINDVQRLITQIGQGEIDEAFVKSAVSVGGSVFGLPAAPINRVISGANAMSEGKTNNPLTLFFGYTEY